MSKQNKLANKQDRRIKRKEKRPDDIPYAGFKPEKAWEKHLKWINKNKNP